MDDIRFTWDVNKDTANRKKHGVSFDEAVSVFDDALARLIPDPDNSTGEHRFLILGLSCIGRLLIVCHCELDELTIRIISARKADRSERRQYEVFHDA